MDNACFRDSFRVTLIGRGTGTLHGVALALNAIEQMHTHARGYARARTHADSAQTAHTAMWTHYSATHFRTENSLVVAPTRRDRSPAATRQVGLGTSRSHDMTQTREAKQLEG